MKKNIGCWLVILINLLALNSYAQQVAINEDGSLPNPNAILDVKSFTKGILIPRVSTTGRLAIPGTKGLLVYDTTTHSFWYNTGAAWQNMAAGTDSSSGWSLNGNSGTNSSHFLGTTDSMPLVFKVNNQPAGRIDIFFPHNAYLGYLAGAATTTGAANTAIGSYVLEKNTTGYYNTAAGSMAMKSNTTGFHNVAYGVTSLGGNTTGFHNTAIGVASLGSNSVGTYNTASGFHALTGNSNGTENTASGSFALRFNTTGSFNTASGSNSLSNNLNGFYNTASGYYSLRLNRGDRNTATGAVALEQNTTGTANTANGSFSLRLNTTGHNNTAVGYASLYTNTTGQQNTAIGIFADVSTGSLTNATAIGFGAFVNASNKVRIGNSTVTRIEGAVPFTTPSDGRFKFAVQEDVKGLDFILKLRPVTYQFDVKRFDELQRGSQNDSMATVINDIMKGAYNEAASIRRSGFIAQEVEKAAMASGYTFSGIIAPGSDKDHYSLSYESFVIPLVKGMQELYAEVERLKRENELLKTQNKKIADLQQQFDALKQLLQQKAGNQ